MAIFIGIHRLGPSSDEQMVQAWETYKKAAEAKGLKPISADYNAEKGIAICKTEASSADEVRSAHEDGGNIPEEIYEVKTGN